MSTTGFLFALNNRPTYRSREIRLMPHVLEQIADPRSETEDELIDRLDAEIGAARLARGRAFNRQSARYDLFHDYILPRRSYRRAPAEQER